MQLTIVVSGLNKDSAPGSVRSSGAAPGVGEEHGAYDRSGGHPNGYRADWARFTFTGIAMESEEAAVALQAALTGRRRRRGCTDS